jgi:ubiquinone/menaquinone biosynthesis C-methylase UbiE
MYRSEIISQNFSTKPSEGRFKRRMSGDFIPALRFKSLTRYYDAVVRLTTRERSVKRSLIEFACVPQEATVVDLGCGTGTLTIWLKQQYPTASVIGLDADPTILEIARSKANAAGVDVEFINCNATDIPLRSGSVDRVVSSLFFHHLSPDIKKHVLDDTLRILASDGQLHVSDWGKPANILMRALFYPVRVLDGFPNTRENVQGLLPALIREAGAGQVAEQALYNTIFGTLRLLRAVK